MITPVQARQFAKGMSKEAEKAIDGALQNAAENNRWPCTISTRMIHVGDAPSAIVLARYRAVGWKVELVHDMRDGDFYQFEAP